MDGGKHDHNYATFENQQAQSAEAPLKSPKRKTQTSKQSDDSKIRKIDDKQTDQATPSTSHCDSAPEKIDFKAIQKAGLRISCPICAVVISKVEDVNQHRDACTGEVKQRHDPDKTDDDVDKAKAKAKDTANEKHKLEERNRRAALTKLFNELYKVMKDLEEKIRDKKPDRIKLLDQTIAKLNILRSRENLQKSLQKPTDCGTENRKTDENTDTDTD